MNDNQIVTDEGTYEFSHFGLPKTGELFFEYGGIMKASRGVEYSSKTIIKKLGPVSPFQELQKYLDTDDSLDSLYVSKSPHNRPGELEFRVADRVYHHTYLNPEQLTRLIKDLQLHLESLKYSDEYV